VRSGRAPLEADEPTTGDRSRSWVGWWIVAAVAAAIALIFNFSGALGLGRLPLIAGAVAPRNAVTLGTLILAILLILIAAVVRPARRALLPILIAVLLVLVVSGGTILGRGVSNVQPVASAPGELRVLSWNINGNLVSPETVATLAADMKANLVVLPQIGPGSKAKFAAALAQAGLDVEPYPVVTDRTDSTVVFVARALGSYRVASETGPQPQRSITLVPVSGALPTIVALHAAQPTLHGNPTWNAEMRWVAGICDHRGVIAVGDFNGTLDSFGGSALGECQDAATMKGAASVGTWPTAAPTWMAMPLDHLLVSPGWGVSSFTVLTSEDRSGARHRPIFVVLQPDATGGTRVG
jgi:endonuclease/exonuclease/phosphatase (EEP) superfamily protein YafD